MNDDVIICQREIRRLRSVVRELEEEAAKTEKVIKQKYRETIEYLRAESNKDQFKQAIAQEIIVREIAEELGIDVYDEETMKLIEI